MYHFVHVEKILLRIKHFYLTFMQVCAIVFTRRQKTTAYSPRSPNFRWKFCKVRAGFFRFEKILLCIKGFYPAFMQVYHFVHGVKDSTILF